MVKTEANDAIFGYTKLLTEFSINIFGFGLFGFALGFFGSVIRSSVKMPTPRCEGQTAHVAHANKGIKTKKKKLIYGFISTFLTKYLNPLCPL